MFEHLRRLSYFHNVFKESFGDNTGFVSAKTQEIHDSQVVGTQRVAIGCCESEAIICFAVAELTGTLVQMHYAQVVLRV